jgi:hypothetical protein
MNMKTILGLILFLLCLNAAHAQKITGLWYSSDSTRVYEIRENSEGSLEAVIKSSIRDKDSPGYVVIKNLEYNSRRKRYEGVIYAVSDDMSTRVKIKFEKMNEKKILLKLSRMFFLDVNIIWLRK